MLTSIPTLLLAAALAASAATPGVPSSSVTAVGFTQAKYCVKSYAPTARVSVSGTGVTDTTIHTDNHGSGCTVLAFQSVCGSESDRSVAATGIGADGNPATSSATLPQPAGAPTCRPTSASKHHSVAGLSSRGLALILLGAAAVLVALVVAGAVALRRRSSAE